MKKDKKMFIFIEAVLGTMVLFLAFLMLREKNVDKSYQISVIVEMQMIRSGLLLNMD